LEDDRRFRYLRADAQERFQRCCDSISFETARGARHFTGLSGEVRSPEPKLGGKLKGYLKRFSIAVYCSKRLRNRRIHWNADIDDLFSAALTGLAEISANLEQAQKLQLVSYAQFRIEREILRELRE